MSRLQLLLLVSAACVLAVACNQRRGNGRPGLAIDGGTDAPIGSSDDGGTTTFDFGLPDLGRDMSSGIDLGHDSGTAIDLGHDSGTSVDLGHDSGDPCGTHTFTHYAGPYCALATATCLNGCADSTCSDDCIAADPSPDNCDGCIQANWLSCAASNGCQSSFDAYICCLDANCPGDAPSATCISTFCGSEQADARSCQDSVASSCAGFANDCFSGST